MVDIFLADGFEETEAVFPFDILKRGGVEVRFLSVYENRTEVTGSHGITLSCGGGIDLASEDDVLVLPGGMPGTLNLAANKKLCGLLTARAAKNKLVAAICAAPTVLGKLGILKDKKATCYPGMQNELFAAEYVDLPAVKCDNVITARGPGAASDFGFALLSELKGKETAEKIKKGMCL